MRRDECEQVGFFGLWRIKSSACSERRTWTQKHTHARARARTHTHKLHAYRKDTQIHTRIHLLHLQIEPVINHSQARTTWRREASKSKKKQKKKNTTSGKAPELPYRNCCRLLHVKLELLESRAKQMDDSSLSSSISQILSSSLFFSDDYLPSLPLRPFWDFNETFPTHTYLQENINPSKEIKRLAFSTAPYAHFIVSVINTEAKRLMSRGWITASNAAWSTGCSSLLVP